MQHPHGFKPFIPAWADDAEWTPAQFRIYAHLCRRAGGKGRAFPSIRSIGRKCHLHKDTVCKCLKALESQGYLKRVRKHGRSNTYFLFTPADLCGATQLPLADIKGQVLSGTGGQGVPETKGQKGIEEKESKERVWNPAPSPVALESAEKWRQRLQARYPAIDVAAELKKAACKKPNFERDWFERHWLPKCTPVVGRKDVAVEQAINQLVYAKHCDEGIAWVKRRYPAADIVSWPDVSINLRQEYAGQVVIRNSPKKT